MKNTTLINAAKKLCYTAVTILLQLTVFSSCSGVQHPSTADRIKDTSTNIHRNDSMIAGSFKAESGIRFDSSVIKKFLGENPVFKEFTQAYNDFYKTNDFNYVWYDKKGLIESSNILIARLMNGNEEGVADSIPYKEKFLKLIHYNDTTMQANESAPDINTELMLTGQYFNYAKTVWAGQLNNKAASLNWYLPRKSISYAELLDKNIKAGDIKIDEDNLVMPQYNGLKKALSQYRQIEKEYDQLTLQSLKKNAVIKPGDTSSIIHAIAQKLMLLGDNGTENISGTGNLYSANLANAVIRFKARHGLKADSLINNNIIKELNVPLKKRIEQLIVNMERLRWIPTDRNSPEFLLVNIPEFTLHYYENHKDVWDCNVVVGTPMTKTVIFSGDLKYVVFSPYWYVPPSILKKEVLPGIKRSSSYLAKHNMEWNGGQVRQKPGSSNSLGLVKFLFPNSNSIYLHDTPSKSLFNEDNRAFSHGCIRVAKPRDLAIRILRQDSTWTPAKIDAAMNAGKEKYVTLKKTIPVYIGYFTSFIDNNGAVNFRQDVYNRDERLLQLLIKN